MKSYFYVWLVLVCGSTRLLPACALAAPAQSLEQANVVKLGILKEANASIQTFIERKDLAGLEQFARQIRSDWVEGDPSTYRSLMVGIARAFAKFPIPNDAPKRLAIEFRELSVRRTGELDVPEELLELKWPHQNWDEVAKMVPSEVVAMREAHAARILKAWQRAEDSWNQIKDRPVIHPTFSNVRDSSEKRVLLDKFGNPITTPSIPIPEPVDISDSRLRTSEEVARDYNFRVGLENNMADYTNHVPGSLGWAFSKMPEDFDRLVALTEQHLKKPESRDAFYEIVYKKLTPEHALSFLGAMRDGQRRRNENTRAQEAASVRPGQSRPGSAVVSNRSTGFHSPTSSVKSSTASAQTRNTNQGGELSTVTGSTGNLRMFVVLTTVCLALLGWIVLRARHAPHPPR